MGADDSVGVTVGNIVGNSVGACVAVGEGVGEGDTAGVWEGAPNLRPDFRALNLKKLEKKARAAKAEQMI